MLKQAAVRSASALFLFCFLGPQIFAQTNSSTIAGVITDASGAAVPDANVTITDAATSQQRNTQSSPSGEYAFPQLAPGRYEIRVQAKGLPDRRIE